MGAATTQRGRVLAASSPPLPTLLLSDPAISRKQGCQVVHQLLGSLVESPVTRVHGDDLLAGQPLVHLLLQRWADSPVLEGFDVHPRYPADVVFGEGNRRGERGHGLGLEPGL